MKIFIPRDNTLSIKSILVSTHVLLNREEDDSDETLVECKDNLKSIDLGMGWYQLNSLVSLLVSPRSYGKPSEEMISSSSAMTLFDTFVQSLVPIQDEKEDVIVRGYI